MTNSITRSPDSVTNSVAPSRDSVTNSVTPSPDSVTIILRPISLFLAELFPWSAARRRKVANIALFADRSELRPFPLPAWGAMAHLPHTLFSVDEDIQQDLVCFALEEMILIETPSGQIMTLGDFYGQGKEGKGKEG